VALTDKYYRWYSSIMDRAKCRDLDDYFERHHIQPRALGGNNEKSNIVKLTYREHFLAHWLLTKFTEGECRRKMQHALAYMTLRKGGRIIAGWQYETAKRARREAMLASWTDERKASHKAKTTGRKNSPEAIANIKASRTEEVRARISAALTGRKRLDFVPWNKGRTLPRKYRAKISATLTGRKLPAEHIANVNSARERRPAEVKAMIDAKISATMMGRKYSPERCANMRAGRNPNLQP
jgi:hypothetical protein